MSDLPFQLLTEYRTPAFVVIAHRGASAYHPENTMAAFKAAVEMEADMIELDITLTKDGIPVVIHDETLDRTTSGKGKVSDFTFEEIRELDAGFWFSEVHAGERVPTLEEVLKFAQNRIALNIEIKHEAVGDSAYGGIEEKALELVKKYGMENYVLFSSFNYQAVSNLRTLDVDIPTALLYEKSHSNKRSPAKLIQDYQTNAFNCSYRKFSKKWAKEASGHNIPVFIYTVNKENKMKKMIKRGATGIFSDKPDLLKQVVDKMWKTK